MDCCICLNKLNEDIFTLSCSHELHIDCFLSLVFNNNMNIFIKCPLCRELNHENLYNTKYEDLNYITHKTRCICITNNNLRCKKKSCILNNGMCHIHNKNKLPKNKYKLMCQYILWLFETNDNFRTKYIMIDIAKCLCIKYENIKTVQEISHYFYYFYHINDKNTQVHWDEMYIFFNLPCSLSIELAHTSYKKHKLII